MPLINADPPPRPSTLDFSSMAELFAMFEEIFLSQESSDVISPVGHRVSIFDHHFFHMASISKEGHVGRLFMRDEKQTIKTTTDGLGPYAIGHGGSRAKHLRAAMDTLRNPDEVWEDNPRAKSRWVYVKEYTSSPYPFSVLLVTDRPEQGLIVPVTGFPCRWSDIKKWRQGERICPP